MMDTQFERLIFRVRLPGWTERGELRLAVWEGPDGAPDRRRYLTESDVLSCRQAEKQLCGYELYDIEIPVSLRVLTALRETDIGENAYSEAAAAFFLSYIITWIEDER